MGSIAERIMFTEMCVVCRGHRTRGIGRGKGATEAAIGSQAGTREIECFSGVSVDARRVSQRWSIQQKAENVI